MTHDDRAGSAVPDLDAIEEYWTSAVPPPGPDRSARADLHVALAHCRALRAEVERLQLEDAKAEGSIDRLIEMGDKLRADNARLRAALEECRHQFFDDGYAAGWVKRMRDRVDAALAGQEAAP